MSRTLPLIPLRNLKTTTYQIPSNTHIPNASLIYHPLTIYPSAYSLITPASIPSPSPSRNGATPCMGPPTKSSASSPAARVSASAVSPTRVVSRQRLERGMWWLCRRERGIFCWRI
ncbi:hypothetical protein K432DRAFT_140088, partial [Lepidopterella palustris CBS 459.81]